MFPKSGRNACPFRAPNSMIDTRKNSTMSEVIQEIFGGTPQAPNMPATKKRTPASRKGSAKSRYIPLLARKSYRTIVMGKTPVHKTAP